VEVAQPGADAHRQAAKVMAHALQMVAAN